MPDNSSVVRVTLPNSPRPRPGSRRRRAARTGPRGPRPGSGPRIRVLAEQFVAPAAQGTPPRVALAGHGEGQPHADEVGPVGLAVLLGPVGVDQADPWRASGRGPSRRGKRG